VGADCADHSNKRVDVIGTQHATPDLDQLFVEMRGEFGGQFALRAKLGE